MKSMAHQAPVVTVIGQVSVGIQVIWKLHGTKQARLLIVILESIGTGDHAINFAIISA
jgi:hypothetical protein